MKNYLRRLWRAIKNEDAELEDVRDFQLKFAQLVYWNPGFLTKRKRDERGRFMQEELKEFLDAATLEDQADALVDLVYVAKGTAVMMGLPWPQLWDDVQRANMAKMRGVTHRGNKVDVMKPPGWVPPDGARILALAGWDDAETPWNVFPEWLLRDDHENRSHEFDDPFFAEQRATRFGAQIGSLSEPTGLQITKEVK